MEQCVYSCQHVRNFPNLLAIKLTKTLFAFYKIKEKINFIIYLSDSIARGWEWQFDGNGSGSYTFVFVTFIRKTFYGTFPT